MDEEDDDEKHEDEDEDMDADRTDQANSTEGIGTSDDHEGHGDDGMDGQIGKYTAQIQSTIKDTSSQLKKASPAPTPTFDVLSLETAQRFIQIARIASGRESDDELPGDVDVQGGNPSVTSEDGRKEDADGDHVVPDVVMRDVQARIEEEHLTDGNSQGPASSKAKEMNRSGKSESALPLNGQTTSQTSPQSQRESIDPQRLQELKLAFPLVPDFILTSGIEPISRSAHFSVDRGWVHKSATTAGSLDELESLRAIAIQQEKRRNLLNDLWEGKALPRPYVPLWREQVEEMRRWREERGSKVVSEGGGGVRRKAKAVQRVDGDLGGKMVDLRLE